MTRTIGIEVGASRAWAVVRGGRGAVETFECPVTGETIDAAVAELQALVGDVASIGLAIGLAHLHVKHVTLPPVPHAAKRQMLMVEPERWFAMAAGVPPAMALDPQSGLAMAADGAFVERWVRACAQWAPVQRVETTPSAIVRAFAAAGQRAVVAMVDAGPGELGVVQIADGALRSVRRLRAADVDHPAVTVTDIPGVATPFVAAYGAALASEHDLGDMLLTPMLEHRFATAQRRRLGVWAVAAIAAVCTAMWSLGVTRERMRDMLERDVADARRAAAAGDQAIVRARTIDRELEAIAGTSSGRAGALESLAALGVRLPRHAVAQRIRMTGNEWQVEGNAATASAVLAALAADPHFDRVRFLAPSNRFRDGTTNRETFAIAFTVR